MDVRHQHIKAIFETVLKNAGLSSFSPVPLLSNDKTVYFTCATITPLKTIIEKEQINHGIYIHQPCLRLQTLNNPFKQSKSYQFPGYFNMLGTLIPQKLLVSFQKNIINIFDCLGIDRGDMKIFSPTTSIPIFSELQKKYAIEFGTKSDNYYRWKYGFKENISGIGLTFSIKQSDGSYRDIGQYVSILKDEKVIGAEFGFGIETFLAASQKFDNPYLAYSVAPALRDNHIDQNFTNTDIISTIGALYTTGLTLQNVPSSNYKRILNRAITNLCFLNSQYHITSDQVKKALYRFMDIEFQSLSGFTSFCSDYDLKLEKYYTEIKKRNDFIKNQQHLGRSPQYIATRLKQLYPMLNHYDKIKE